MCATFFAKTESLCQEGNQEVKEVHKRFNSMESSFINPAKVVDAKLFALN